MIGRVKKFLGIEGVKLELIIPEEIRSSDAVIGGALRFQSMHPQTVTRIRIVLIERYSRGRGNEKLVDEYQLGSTELEETFEVPADEIIERDFTLPFTLVRSDVEEFGARNFLFGGIAKAAKMIRNARSEYRVEAEAEVKGTALNPFDKKFIRVR